MNLKQVVEYYLACYNNLDIKAMLDCFADDCVFENVSNSGQSMICEGKDQLRQTAEKMVTIFTSRRQTPTNWVIGSDSVAIEINYHAVFSIDLPNGLKAGQPLSLKGVSFFTFANGKIKRLADFS